MGQYQHDVSQTRLARSLEAVVEDCVNAVGVDVNTASAALLARVSGLSGSLAEAIVRHRDEHGAFASREALKKVPRLGAKTFEQSAGFLRVLAGTQPLDRSAVHPEAYPIVERILADLQRPLIEVMGEARLLREIDASRYTDEQFGLPTVRDILRELEKPGRDPRPEFKTAAFQEGVEDLKDLQPGMLLEGAVTNVTNFGAFVDIGVHQDGLVHVSMLSHRFVKDPRELVKAGDIVKVKVLEVDLQRRRIALTMKLDAAPAPRLQADQVRGRGEGPRDSRAGDSRPRDSRPRDGRPGDTRSGAPARAARSDARPRNPRPGGDRQRSEQPSVGEGVMAEALARALRKG